jgi:hypothetical protein
MAARFPTDAELTALRLAIGGITTRKGTPAHAVYERLDEEGWVKVVTLTDDGIAWKLSGDGISYAFAAEARR